MDCCQCQGIEKTFDKKIASKDLRKYRSQGPDRTTLMLIEALKQQGVQGLSLLDVGGGVGAIQHELLSSGVATAVGVDASSAYISAAKEEAERQGHADRVSYRFGNIVDLGKELDGADIVTLDRVICCYHDARTLVRTTGNLAGKYYGVVYPRYTFWLRAGWRVVAGLFAVVQRIKGNSFRAYLHSTEEVESILSGIGFHKCFHSTKGLWQVAVYARQS